MWYVNPMNSEPFHLRLLLTKIKGAEATSFEDLMCYNRLDHGSYKSACLARGFIRDDSEWVKCMEEAVMLSLPDAIRTLFARILAHCAPAKPLELWDRFNASMSEDFAREHRTEIALNLTLRDIAEKLTHEGKRLSDFASLPQLESLHFSEAEINADEELNKALDFYSTKLTDEQKLVIDPILCLLDIPLPDSSQSRIQDFGNNSNAIFVHGPGGSGKTTIYKVINNFINGYNKKVSNSALMGIAATLLPKGRTMHNQFWLPVPIYADSNPTIEPNSQTWKQLEETDAFIIDEAPMASRHMITVINSLMQQVMESDSLFGGKVFLFGGDFAQTLPIQKRATRA
jgi:hypothetical protein